MWRPESVGRQIREIVSELVHHRLKDPRLGYVTITDVDVTRDLKSAKIFVSVMGDPEARDDTLAVLVSATPFLRRELGQRIRLRHTPEIQFEYDDSLERGARIDKILDDLKP
ncbi:MAG: 30S ribosome-binding factor RbfA [Candidatus Latescibacteria bacterium]|jgi:ribosome-binding factor A|nr:30S ribosome-binding factor RbfA [Candidatus Latescibacterota bacterium]